MILALSLLSLLSSALCADEEIVIERGEKGWAPTRRGGLVMSRPDFHQQYCAPSCSDFSVVHRVPPPPRHHRHHCRRSSSSSSSSCSCSSGTFWDNQCYRPVVMPPRPPPSIGSAENVQVLSFGQPIISPILLNATWSIDPVLNIGLFDPVTLEFTGSNNDPIGIDSVLSPLNLEDTFYFSATAAFSAIPLSPITSTYGIDEDPQYGSGLISVFDPTTGFRFGFVLTNSLVYILYQKENIDPLKAFRYLVPIAPRSFGVHNSYAIAVSRALRTVTFLIDGTTRLAICRPGGPLDSKFLVSTGATIYSQADFPAALQSELAIFAMLLDSPACQQTIFDPLNPYQVIQNASQMVCTNGPLQVLPFLTNSTLSVSNMATYRVNHVYPPA